MTMCCCWYHKGTNFQANHNNGKSDWRDVMLLLIPQRYEFSSKSQLSRIINLVEWVVADTTKVRIFKQITTVRMRSINKVMLLLIPQRYEFSSKSQRRAAMEVRNLRCCWYHKGTNFQANHNKCISVKIRLMVVADTTKVRIFKQITTAKPRKASKRELLLIPQRYEFSSKSQLIGGRIYEYLSCCWYHKGTNFQANHNDKFSEEIQVIVVADTTKVRIFKQITTTHSIRAGTPRLLLIPQRYEFSSKSQLVHLVAPYPLCCCWYHKGTNFQANHNWCIW